VLVLPQDLIRGEADGKTVAQCSSFAPKLNVACMDDVVSARDKDVSPRSVQNIRRMSLHGRLCYHDENETRDKGKVDGLGWGGQAHGQSSRAVVAFFCVIMCVIQLAHAYE
jgi:hypothetical protein